MNPRRPVPLRSLVAAVSAASLACAGGTSGGSAPAPRADHTTVTASAIPLPALDGARALRMHLRHASVGVNIWGGLTTLAAENAARYAIPHWTEHDRGNPTWQEKLTEFSSFVAANAGSHDVFQMKFCYIDQDASFASYRDLMLSLEAAHPTKTFIWWTMPLQRSGANNGLRAAFNEQVRSFCALNRKPLYDIADIESHDASGNPVTSGGYEALAPAWTTDGGHLEPPGSARAAHAMWWLMARIAGWSG